MRSIKRTLIAIILAVTLFFNVACGKDNDEAEDPPPDALTALNVSYNEIQTEASRVAQKRDYMARMDVVIAEIKRKEAERIAAIVAAQEAERQRVASLVAAEAKRKATQAQIATAQAVPSRSQDYVGQAQTYQATAYTAGCYGCSGITRTGVDLRKSIYHDGRRVIAVDPHRIPLGSIVRVTLSNGSSFEAIAEDTGGRIQGAIIDVAHETKADANRFGRQSVEVRMIRKGR